GGAGRAVPALLVPRLRLRPPPRPRPPRGPGPDPGVLRPAAGEERPRRRGPDPRPVPLVPAHLLPALPRQRARPRDGREAGRRPRGGDRRRRRGAGGGGRRGPGGVRGAGVRACWRAATARERGEAPRARWRSRLARGCNLSAGLLHTGVGTRTEPSPGGRTMIA